jgi:hypothetical protein
METFHFDLLSGSWMHVGGAAILAALIGYVGYWRTIPEVSPRTRILLATLRSVAIFVLLLVLFEPVIRYVMSLQAQPDIVVLIDESRSSGLHDVKRNRKDDMKALAAIVTQRLGNRAKVAVFHETVAEVGAHWTPDSLSFQGSRTDITSALRWAGNRSLTDGAGAILLLTDGNHNTGDGPVFESTRIGIPVYAIGIGDTTPPKDISVTALIGPSIAIVGIPSGITATLNAEGFQGEAVRIELLQNNLVVSTSTIEGLRRRDRRTIDMEWTPSEVGTQSIAIRAVPLDREFTKDNNVVADDIVVRSNKRKLVILAGAPSADVSFVSQALRNRPEIDVQTFVMKPGGSFYESSPTLQDLASSEAIITIGFPGNGCPAAVIELVRTAVLNKGKPLLWIGGPNIDYNLVRRLDDVLPFMVLSVRPRETQVTMRPRGGTESNSLLKLSGTTDDATTWSDAAPIYRQEMFVRPVDGAKVIATIGVNNVTMEEPLLLVREGGGFRSMSLLGYGIYRWKLLNKGMADARGDAHAVDILSSWIDNSVQWLAVRPDDKRVRIRPTRRPFLSGESVELIATVRDETDRDASDADVILQYRTPNGIKTVAMVPTGGGKYTATLGPMPPGMYTFDGHAKRTGVALGSDSGRWTVADVDVESLATTIDTTTLSMIAMRSKGVWGMYEQAGSVLDALERDPRLLPRVVSQTTETALWASPLLLGLSIVFLAIEWFIRKRHALV